MSGESAILEWKNYSPTASEAFQRLYEDTDFTDVTIACEDNQKIEAHKVILNMCSNIFSNILKNNPNPHPLIYLQGISIENLTLLKKFMYKGKTTVFKGQLDSFMKLSKTFLNCNQESTSAGRHKETLEKEVLSKIQYDNHADSSQQNEKSKDLPEFTSETFPNHIKGDNLRDNQRQSNNQHNNTGFFPIKLKQEKLKCNQCEFSTLYASKFSKHNKNVHIEQPCPTCKI